MMHSKKNDTLHRSVTAGRRASFSEDAPARDYTLFPLAEMLAPGYLDLCSVICEREAKGSRGRGRYKQVGGERRAHDSHTPHLQLVSRAGRVRRRKRRDVAGSLFDRA